MSESEFNIGSDEAPTPTEVAAVEAVELSMDDLFKIAVDNEAAKQVLKDMLAPAGTYTTEPPLVAIPGRSKDGRENVRFFGPAVLGEVKERFGFTLSWQRRNKIVQNQDGSTTDTGKPDYQSGMWAQARGAYRTVYGQDPDTIGQVIAYLRDYPVRIGVIQMGTGPNAKGQPGNLVVSISPVVA